MIKNVFIDLDDTLLDFLAAEKAALTRTLLNFGITPDERVLARYSAINDAQWKLLEKGEITREQVKWRRYALLFEEFGIECDPLAVNDHYMEELSKGHIFMEGAKELLDALFGNYRLYLASNGTAWVQERRLKSADLNRYFDGIFISQQMGYDKPDPRFFERAFATIPDFSKEETVMVGDSLTSDIKGGQGAGLYTLWFNPKGKVNHSEIQPDNTFTRLSDLPELLKGL